MIRNFAFLLKINERRQRRHRIKDNYVYADVSFIGLLTSFMFKVVNFINVHVIHFTDKDVKSYPFVINVRFCSSTQRFAKLAKLELN